MSCGLDAAGRTTRRGSCSSPGKEESTKDMMDHDIFVLASRLEEEITCLSSFASSKVWYIDSRASTHMMRIQECFSSYQEEKMNFQITMGNKAKCTPVGRGTIVFQTEAGDRLQDTNVLHVPGLGMNLLSVSELQIKAMMYASLERKYMSNI